MIMAPTGNVAQQTVLFPAEEIAKMYLGLWHRDSGDFKHLGLKRMYAGTNYVDIEKDTYNHDVSEADNILRYNMFYILHRMKNAKNTMIQFTRYGLLAWDKKDEIVGHNKHETLMRIQFLQEVLKISKSKFATVEKAFKDSDNQLVWDLLKPPGATASVSAATSRQPRAAQEQVETPRWECSGCTSPNPIIVDSCLVCTTPRAGLSAAGTATTVTGGQEWTCSVCSAKNDHLLRYCSVCESAKVQVPVVDIEEVADVGGRWDCTSCTYNNAPAAVECFMCRAPKDLNKTVPLGDHRPTKPCRQCTALNPEGATRCDLCNFRLRDLFESATESGDSSVSAETDDHYDDSD